MKPHTVKPWSPTVWTAAMLRLCSRHQVETADEIIRYPEQWLYCLWRPSSVAVPFRRPDCYGLAVDDPFVPIRRDIDTAPLYIASDEECYWPALLDIPLACQTLEPWLLDLLRSHRDRQLLLARERSVNWYGSDLRDFQNFLRSSGAMGTDLPGDVG